MEFQITSTRANSFEKSFMSVSLADLLCSSQQLRPATIEKVSSERLTLNCNMDDNCRPYNRNIKLTELGASKVDVESEQGTCLKPTQAMCSDAISCSNSC